MARRKAGRRRTPKSNPRGVLEVTHDGYGFVKTAEGEFFIPRRSMAGAFDGDMVEVAPLPSKEAHGVPSRFGKRPKARVTQVVIRAHEALIGRYEVAEPFGVVVPEDPRIPYDIFTMRADAPHVPDGALVRVRVSAFPSRREAATGVVEEVLGSADDDDMLIDLIIARHKLETSFSPAALEQARAAVLDEEGALREGYRDLRSRFIFTIDPADARDFDDALSLEYVGGSTWESAHRKKVGLRAQTVLSSLKTPTGRFGSLRRREASPFRGTARGIPPSSDELQGGCEASSSRETARDTLALPRELQGGREGSFPGAIWRLGVHIADVSHYVPWDSSLDLDARRRATSVYLADRVIPMLPEELSADLCSLKPGAVRRTMTVDLYLDAQGNLVGTDFYLALIESKRRLTYDEAQDLLDAVALPSLPAERAGFAQQPSYVIPSEANAVSEVEESSVPDSSSFRAERRRCEVEESHAVSADGSSAMDATVRPSGVSAEDERLARCLRELSRLAKRRAARRVQRGGIDFASVEAKVRLDAEGHAQGIDLRRKTDATELVEEAMILANEAVAAHLSEHSFPSLYRVHEQPAPDALSGLVPVLQEFPWFGTVSKERLLAGDPHAVQQVLAASLGRPEEELVSSLMLRAMKRAVYRPTCEGHYGLASQAYTHFTSPIRRYPDLVVHRMLKAQLTAQRMPGFKQQTESLAWVAEHSSDAERVADAAARESQECKIIEYLQGSVGQAFSAVVSGVATYGLYVRLENTAEGLVPVRDLGDEYFALDPVRHTLTGQDSGREWRLGQRVAVVLKAADLRTRTLAFRLAGSKTGKEERSRS